MLMRAAFRAKVDLVGEPPLTRTKNATAGENRIIEASFAYDIGNGQLLNCFRLMLNGAGLDLQGLPNDGPIADHKVEWELRRGAEAVRLCKQECGLASQPGDTFHG